MEIKILGGGCTKCKKLYQNVVLATSEKGINAEIIKITDFEEISKYNVMQTPALVIDEKVVAKGTVLSKEEIIELL